MEAEFLWNNVKRLIREQGTTQEKLAEKCDINFRTLQNQISRNIMPDSVETYKIAQALNTTVEYLLTGNDAIKPDLKPLIKQIRDIADKLDKL
jgi:transcriptional regulator with XRE-family HTH domain